MDDSTTKTCTRCKQAKPRSEFHKRAKSPDGLRPMCKVCVKAYQQEWKADPAVAAHRAAYEKQRQQTEERRQQQNAIARRRYARADQQIKRQVETEQRRQEREQARAIRIADPAYQEQRRRKQQAYKSSPRALAQRRRRRAERYTNDPTYRDRVLEGQHQRADRYRHLSARAYEKHKERYANDPDYRRAYNAQVNTNIHRRRARKKANGGSYTVQQWRELCAKYDHRCLCCGQAKRLTPDHIVPISKGGTNDISNIQPLCLSCNLRKSAQTIDYRPPA